MPGQVDHLSLLECDERNGVIISLKRRARVVGMSPIPVDHTVLYRALEESGVPPKWSQLDSTAGQNLLLIHRTPKVVDADKGVLDVDLTYSHVAEANNQDLKLPVTQIQGIGPPKVIFGKVKSSVRQVETNRAPRFVETVPANVNVNNPFNGLDMSRHQPGVSTPIIVAFRQPPGGAGAAAGAPKVQGGKVTVLKPNSTWTVEGFLSTTTPWIVEAHYLGNVNRDNFLGRTARTVMCTEVEWQLAGRTSDPTNSHLIYWFAFEFQHDPAGFDPDVVARDPDTQRPLPNANPYYNPTTNPDTGVPFMTGNSLRRVFPMPDPNYPEDGMMTWKSDGTGWAARLDHSSNRVLGMYKLFYYKEVDFNLYIAKPEGPNVTMPFGMGGNAYG